MTETARAVTAAARAIAGVYPDNPVLKMTLAHRHNVPALFATLLLLAFVPSLHSQETTEALERRAAAAEQAGQVREAFDLYVRAFQTLPEPAPTEVDLRLRQRLIALAPKLQPPPAIPEDAERFSARGKLVFNEAKDKADLERAATELSKAVRAAPWVPELAFNLALVQEKAGFYRAAGANLKLYLSSNPEDQEQIRSKLYEMELRREDRVAAALEDCADGSIRACMTVVSDASVSFVLDRPVDQRTARRAYSTVVSACETKHYTPACGLMGELLIDADDGSTNLKSGLMSIGVRPDLLGGEKRLVLACSKKERTPCFMLSQRFHSDSLGQRRWYYDTLRQLCESSAWACNFLGFAHEEGGDLKADLKAARSWYAKGGVLAKQGCDSQIGADCAALAWLYRGEYVSVTFTGLGADRSLAGAFYQRACDLNVDDGGNACRAAKLFQSPR